MTRILMAEATDFQGTTQVGSHALAREFAKNGAEVCWIGTPFYPWTLLRRSDAHTSRRVEVWERGGALAAERITEYYPLTCLPVVDRPLFRTRFAAAQTLRATGQARANIIARNRSVIVVIHSLNRSVIVVMDPRTLSVIVVIPGGDRTAGADDDRQCKSRESKSLQSLHHISLLCCWALTLRVTFQSPCRRGRYALEVSGGPSERRTFNPTRGYA